MKLLRLLVVYALVTPAYCVGVSQWQEAARDIEAAHLRDPQQTVSNLPGVTVLMELLEKNVNEGNGDLVAAIIRDYDPSHAVWQVVANFSTSYLPEAFTNQQVESYIFRVFDASLREGNHFLKYNIPRNWLSPYNVRYRLVKNLYSRQANVTSAVVPDLELLNKSPSDWRSKHFPHIKTTQEAPSHSARVVPPLDDSVNTPKDRQDTTVTSPNDSVSLIIGAVIIVLVAAWLFWRRG